MLLTTAIVNLGNELLSTDNNWYEWKAINPKLLPNNVVLPEKNQYHQNVYLKQRLHQLWQDGIDETKISLVHYYISTWGSVRRNSPENIKFYALQSPDELIELGTKGVASWSKALCVQNPHRYAIYDARVAVSLNALQIINKTDSPQLFPILMGQNKRVNKAGQIISDHAFKNKWQKLGADKFYKRYLEIISEAATQLNCDIYTVEMLLFARVLSLFEKAFPNEEL
jgi:hypothetical protein